MNNNKIFFKNLDSIRFIAAVMVYLQHGVKPSFKYLSIKNNFLEKLLNIVSDGSTGVSIFFVLSGFLISYLLISEYQVTGKIALFNFYLRRIFRIWPLYFLVVIFSFLVYPVMKTFILIHNPTSSHFLYYISFLSNFDVINLQSAANTTQALSQMITWSVAVEEQFYLFWPLLFILLPQKTWLYAILFVATGSIAFRMYHYNNFSILYFHTFAVLIDLAIGGLMAYLIKSNKKIESFFKNSSTFVHAILFALSFFLLFCNESFTFCRYQNAISRIFISLSFGLIIAAQAITTSKSIFNLYNLSFANRWGKYTYGIYLIHPIVLAVLAMLQNIIHFYANNFFTAFFFGIVGFIFTLILSKISYVVFESKFLKFKKKYTVV